ncbi:MAG: NrfD/PsrC family molybdoenzyme membrane anchor subunit [Dehalococcoidales bacterium]|jgi:formate-dependent nitrite reductase membrane component NrfD
MSKDKPFEFMVKPQQQKDWVDGRGNFIAFAFFLGGIAGGLFLISAYFDNLLGIFISFLLTGCMGAFYMMHLTHPMRFWRMMRKPGTSWIARGFSFIMAFGFFTVITMILMKWAPDATGAIKTFKVLAGIFAFAQSIYTGFAVSYVSAIKVWNTAIVPVLFVTCGLTGGLAILLAVMMGQNSTDIATLENIIRIVLIALAVIIGVYLWNTTYSSAAAKGAVMRLIGGSLAPLFWIGVFVFGIAVPITISVTTYFTGHAADGLLITAVVSEIIGGLALRFSILKAGMYTPLLPVE